MGFSASSESEQIKGPLQREKERDHLRLWFWRAHKTVLSFKHVLKTHHSQWDLSILPEISILGSLKSMTTVPWTSVSTVSGLEPALIQVNVKLPLTWNEPRSGILWAFNQGSPYPADWPQTFQMPKDVTHFRCQAFSVPHKCAVPLLFNHWKLFTQEIIKSLLGGCRRLDLLSRDKSHDIWSILHEPFCVPFLLNLCHTQHSRFGTWQIFEVERQ